MSHGELALKCLAHSENREVSGKGGAQGVQRDVTEQRLKS